MNVRQLKIHVMRGLIRPEYFKIPLLGNESGDTIFIEIIDENGKAYPIDNIHLSYYTYKFYHDYIRKEDGSYEYIIDDEYKGYAFEEDVHWQYPVPVPSQWELLPVNFENNPPTINNSEITRVGQRDIAFSFTPRNKIAIKNVYPGIYNISFSDNKVHSKKYYPTYYNDYEEPLVADHSSGMCMVDRHNKFSGFNYLNYYNPQYGYPDGYNFFCSSQKFKENTMPIVVTLKHTLKFVGVLIDTPGYTGETFTEKANEKVFTHLRGNYYSNLIEHFTETYVGSKIGGVKIYVDDEYKGTVSGTFWVYVTKPDIITNIQFDDYNAISYDRVQSDEIQIGIEEQRADVYMVNYDGSKAYNTPPMVYLDNHAHVSRQATYPYYPEVYSRYAVANYISNGIFNVRGSASSVRVYESKTTYFVGYGTSCEHSIDGGLYFYPVGNEHSYGEETIVGDRWYETPTKSQLDSNAVLPWSGSFTETEVGNYRYAYFKDVTPSEYIEYMNCVNKPNYTVVYEFEN